MNNNRIFAILYTYILIIIHELYMNITIVNQSIMNICKVWKNCVNKYNQIVQHNTLFSIKIMTEYETLKFLFKIQIPNQKYFEWYND